MNARLPVVMLGMSRYHSWLQGVSNRQLELLNVLRQRPEVGPILFVDMNPWRWRDVIKYGLEMRLIKLPPVLSKWRRRLFKVDNNFYVLSSISRLGVGKWQKLADDIREAMKIISLSLPREGLEQGLSNMSQAVIWSYVPTSAELVAALPRRLAVFDAVDNWLAHPSYQRYASALSQGYEQWADLADLIFTVNPHNQKLFSGRHDVIHVANGVALNRYQVNLPVPAVLAKLPRPILGYVGTIQDRLDINIIKRLAADFSHGSLVFIGPVWYRALARRLKSLPNVHLLGRQPREKIPAFIKNFDVGLVPHRLDAFVKSTEAMKVYEYLAAGLPVVITTGSEFGSLQKYLYSAAAPAEFSSLVANALAEDNPDLRQQRQLAVAEADWSQRLNKIMDHIQQRLN